MSGNHVCKLHTQYMGRNELRIFSFIQVFNFKEIMEFIYRTKANFGFNDLNKVTPMVTNWFPFSPN